VLRERRQPLVVERRDGADARVRLSDLSPAGAGLVDLVAGRQL
jgi:hypothetical protein